MVVVVLELTGETLGNGSEDADKSSAGNTYFLAY